jgi:transcriptional regulator with XRE-family HTH domain
MIDKILENIKRIRKEKGISIEEMAEGICMTRTAYSKTEKGQTQLTVIRLEQIAKTLKVRVGELYISANSNETIIEGKFRIVQIDSLDKNLEDLQALKNQL